MDASFCLLCANPTSESLMTEYSLIKLLHVGALILWLGPALGAWIVVKLSEKHTSPNNQLSAAIFSAFFLLITLEHIAFIFLIGSGIYLTLHYELLDFLWLQQKLLWVFCLIIPLEIIDIILGNWLAAKASKKYYSGQKLSYWEGKILHYYHGIFTHLAIVLIPTSVLIVMWLAIFKAPF